MRTSALILLGILSTAVAPAGDPPISRAAAIEQRIDSLLALMTVEEKVGQLCQFTNPMEGRGESARIPAAHLSLIRHGRVGSYLNVIGADETRKFQEIALHESRLKIPLLFGFDVIHGFRTIFPIPLAEACTWDPELVQRAAHVAATEAAAAGIHWTFGPMVDIARDPRWGRIAEGSGEDPYLGSRMAVARVRGFQGSDLTRPDAIAACVKHYAAYGGAEGGRDYNTVDISERGLRETYLPPFEAAVKAGAASLMCSFNEIAGIPSSGNHYILTDILRGEWKFDGFVVSDWGSIRELQAHGFVPDQSGAARAALAAGVDMDMEGNAYANHLDSLVRAGSIPLRMVDEAVERVLRAKFRLGLFDDPARGASAVREREILLAPAHRELAREVARRSMVLLKNDRAALPLGPNVRRLAVIGPLAAAQRDLLGCWAGAGDSTDVVSPLAALRGRCTGGIDLVIERGCDLLSPDRTGLAAAVAAAKNSDAALLFVGESAAMSGEAASRAHLGLPGVQGELVQAVAATGIPTIVILFNGRPLAIPDVAGAATALLEAWAPGVEGGNAIADILFGDANPSGKLTTTFPRAVGQIPIHYNHKSTGRPADPDNHYTSKYSDEADTPLYPFGYGLSYTSFAYSPLSLSTAALAPGMGLIVSVTVRNTGMMTGEEVVQLYLQDVAASVTRPVRELKRFTRITLPPGGSQRVEFTLESSDCAFLGPDLKPLVEPGEFRVFVGGNCRDTVTGEFRFTGGE